VLLGGLQRYLKERAALVQPCPPGHRFQYVRYTPPYTASERAQYEAPRKGRSTMLNATRRCLPHTRGQQGGSQAIQRAAKW